MGRGRRPAPPGAAISAASVTRGLTRLPDDVTPASAEVEQCVVWPDGTRRWYADGVLHRAHGPAIERANGGWAWYHHGRKHRIGGPAVEYPSGLRVWYRHGRLNRDDGPAIESPDGNDKWFVDGSPRPVPDAPPVGPLGRRSRPSALTVDETER